MNEIVKLTPEERSVFDAFTNRRIAEAAARNDEEELAALRDILTAVRRDGLTPTPDGGESFVRRKAVDWTDPATVVAAQTTAGGKNLSRSGLGGKGNNRDMFQGILMLTMALFAAFYFLWPSGAKEPGRGKETATAALTAERTRPVGPATGTPAPTLESELLASIVDSSGVKTELVTPRTLEVKGVTFVVQPVQIRAGDWLPPDDERVASWIYGTAINYVLGIEASGPNKELLASLRPGDELLLRMSTGPAYRFAYADVVRVAPQASEIFRQNRPGLTLTLLSDEEQATRVVMRANYLPESEASLAVPNAEAKVAVGETVVLDDLLQLTCLGNRVLYLPTAPPGYVYMAVEYRVEPAGGNLPLAAGSFAHHLEAEGLTYPVVAVPHEVNPYPNLPESLPPGQVFTTTAVYAVPETTLRDLTWEFAASPAGEKARVALLPYLGPLAPTVEARTAALNEGILTVTVAISAGLHSLNLNAADIRVDGGAFSPIGNTFPWQVTAGSAAEFTLALTPDGKGRMTVALLEQGFELEYEEGRE